MTVPLGIGSDHEGSLAIAYQGGPPLAATNAIFDVTGYFAP